MRNQRQTRTLINKVLQRVGFFDSVDASSKLAKALTIDRAALFSPHRLRELEESYRQLKDCPPHHSHWTQTNIAIDDYSNLRAESPYMWLARDGNVPVTYLATYYHQLLSDDRDLLALCTEDREFGPECVEVAGELISRDRLDSVSELGFIRRLLHLTRGSSARILDIGSGYGRLGWRINQCFPDVEVLCTDAIAQSSFLCEAYLKFRGASPKVRMVPLTCVREEISSQPVTLATMINSLSECSLRAIVWWIELLADNKVPALLFVPHAAYEGGSRIFSHEGVLGAPVAVEPILAEYGYIHHSVHPKYPEPALQRFGVSPTHFHVFSR